MVDGDQSSSSISSSRLIIGCSSLIGGRSDLLSFLR